MDNLVQHPVLPLQINLMHSSHNIFLCVLPARCIRGVWMLYGCCMDDVWMM